MQEPLLAARAVTFERDGVPVFAPVDLSLCAHDGVEVVGPNGSGKTTLLRCLAGLNVDVEGDLRRSAPVAYIGHRLGLNPTLTGMEQLRWYAALSGTDVDPQGLRDVLAQTGVPQAADVPCGRLSEGQQRRVGLARLLVDRAEVWLLDEPLTALDESGRTMVRALLEQHRSRGGAVVCATHQRIGLEAGRELTLDARPGARA